MLKGLINYLGLQLGWLACAWGAGNGYPWLGPVVVALHIGIHIYWSEKRQQEAVFIFSVTILGIFVDSLQKVTGLVDYAADFQSVPWLAPAWIVAMWALFATAINSSLQWLNNRYGLAFLLGAIFGPLSYRAGAAFGAATFPFGETISLIILALIWGTVMPLLISINQKLVSPSKITA
jgi:hypothetical protein